MDLLSKLYKTKCEQLQEQINFLENKLALLEVNAWSPPSGGPAIPESDAGNIELEDRMRQIRKPKGVQTDEYKAMEDELNRRRGIKRDEAPASQNTVALSADSPDWIRHIEQKWGKEEAEKAEAIRYGVLSLSNEEDADYKQKAAGDMSTDEYKKYLDNLNLPGRGVKYAQEVKKGRDSYVQQVQQDVESSGLRNIQTPPAVTSPKPAEVPATKTTTPGVKPEEDYAKGTVSTWSGKNAMDQAIGLMNPQQYFRDELAARTPAKESGLKAPSATSDLVNAGLNAAATKAVEIAKKVSDFMKMNLAQTTPVSMRTKLYGETEATGAGGDPDVQRGQFPIFPEEGGDLEPKSQGPRQIPTRFDEPNIPLSSSPSAAPFVAQTRDEIPTYKIGPTLPTSYVVPESQKWNEMSKDEQVAMAVAALRAGESHKFFGGREKTEGGFLGIGGKRTARFSEDNAGDTPEEIARLNRQAKMLNKLLDEYDTRANQDEKKLADELAKQQKAAEQVSQAMKPGSKIKYSDLPFITSNLMKNVPLKKYSKKSEAPKEERASEATRGRAELIPPHYQRVRPNDETHPQEYDVDEQFENALEYQSRAMAKAHLDSTSPPVHKGEIRWSQETEDYYTDKYKEMLKKYYFENKK